MGQLLLICNENLFPNNRRCVFQSWPNELAHPQSYAAQFVCCSLRCLTCSASVSLMRKEKKHSLPGSTLGKFSFSSLLFLPVKRRPISNRPSTPNLRLPSSHLCCSPQALSREHCEVHSLTLCGIQVNKQRAGGSQNIHIKCHIVCYVINYENVIPLLT